MSLSIKEAFFKNGGEIKIGHSSYCDGLQITLTLWKVQTEITLDYGEIRSSKFDLIENEIKQGIKQLNEYIEEEFVK